MLEIEKLHNMLTDVGIEHLWIDRTPPGYTKHTSLLDSDIFWGWQIKLKIEEPFFSAIEGYGSYGYGLRGENGDHIEIMLGDEVTGWLKADDVFKIIKELLCGTK